MENHQRPWKLGSIGSYFRKAFKFYDLKNEQINRVIFVILLIVSFAGAFLPDNQAVLITFNIVSLVIIYFASTIYLTAYIKDLKGEEYNWRTCLSTVAKSFFRIMATSFTFIITAVAVTALFLAPEAMVYVVAALFIPGVIASLMFILNTCYVVDRNTGIVDTYKCSMRSTRGYKGGIFGIFLAFNLALSFPMSIVFLIALSANNQLVTAFVLAFLGAIVNLMQQRLIALIYRDLEYRREEQPPHEV